MRCHMADIFRQQCTRRGAQCGHHPHILLYLSSKESANKNDDGIYEDYIVEIFKAEAHTAKNNRIWNQYCMSDDDPDHETGNMDVWIEFAAELEQGYIKGGAYLTDIWQTGGTDYRQHMYIRRAEWA